MASLAVADLPSKAATDVAQTALLSISNARSLPYGYWLPGALVRHIDFSVNFS